jgi:type I restriction enzyme R subunit
MLIWLQRIINTSQITGDNDEGKRELDNFINPEENILLLPLPDQWLRGADANPQKLLSDANNNSNALRLNKSQVVSRINVNSDKLWALTIWFGNIPEEEPIDEDMLDWLI